MLNKWNNAITTSNAGLYTGLPASGTSESVMLSNYEISDDLNRVHIQCLERKYGGRLRAHKAASKIQEAYRHYRLCQQWKQVVSQAPNSTRVQKCTYPAEDIFQTKFSSSKFSREGHLRKLAQSHPSLKYQPLTSLTAQLRAERCDGVNSPLCSPTTSSCNDGSRDQRSENKFQSAKQPHDSLSSPKLAQKRPNLSLYQQQKTANDEDGIAQIDGRVSNHVSEPNTVVLYDSDREKEATQGLLTVSDATNFIYDTSDGCGYRRSASPHSRHNSIANNTNDGQFCDSSPFHENTRKHSPTYEEHLVSQVVDYESQSGKTNVSPRANWTPRYSDGNVSSHPGMNWPMSEDIVRISSQNAYYGKTVGILPRHQLSPVNIANYNANSLPRVSTKHSQGNEPSLLVRVPKNIAGTASGTDIGATRSVTPRIHNRTNSCTRRGASPSALSNRRAASRDQLNNHSVENHTSLRDSQPAQQSQSDSRLQMRGWRDSYRRRLYRIALNFFNKKPDRGVQLLIAWGFVENNPRSIARVFLERRGLSKQKIGEFLGTIKSPFHYAILEHFIDEIPMYDMDIDKALRQLLVNFRLPGEAQKIDHIMQVFAARYRFCNPERFPPDISSDTLYILAFAIIMLNTDLHTPSLKDSKRMKLDEFIKNICGINEGQLLDKNMLQGIYERVREHEFRTGADHVTQVMKVDQSIIGKDKPKLVEPHRRLICYCRLNQVSDPNKKQAANLHQREVFLFNDLMIVAKIFSKRKSIGQYMLRYWTPLIGIRIESFQNVFYNFGLMISCPDGQDLVFNAKNADDRLRFMADVRESVLESTEMEQLRIELELGKHNAANSVFGKYAGGEKSNDKQSDDISSTQRDSGLPEIDQPCSSSQQPELSFHRGADDEMSPADGCGNTAKCSYIQLHQLRNKTSITPFNSTNSVTSAFSAGYSMTSDCSNSGTPQRKTDSGGNMTPLASRFLDKHNNRMTPGSAQHPCSSSARLSNGVAGPAAVINNSAPPGARRLSFNSLDSGMVEESVDYPA